MALLSLTVNGAAHEVDVEASTPLLYVLRNDLGLQGPRFGCGLAQCGACTVLVNGAAIRSCVTPVSAISGEITTLEGLAKDGQLDPLQQAWIDEQVPQCGYCQNGQILTARVLLDANPNPTDAEIRAGMEGALCRCMTYYRIQAAIKRAIRETAAASFRDEGGADGARASTAAPVTGTAESDATDVPASAGARS
jgi:aerobic-type carbon monoxide dehydrogenase small subunit (CoxS/CutS family)